MTRRDTIIIATLVNAGLLACLFVTATRQEGALQEDSIFEPAPYRAEVASTEPSQTPFEKEESNEVSLSPYHDEVDQALKEFLPDASYGTPLADKREGVESELNPELVKEAAGARSEKPAPLSAGPKQEALTSGEAKIVEVKVKKGDILAKIAKANGTTVKAIKEANNLTSDNLRIGQILKVPTGTVATAAPKKPEAVQKESSSSEYYTVQSGDNPWKIAKKFHVRFEDILKLNDMTEAKAKNLKVGQEIRVK